MTRARVAFLAAALCLAASGALALGAPVTVTNLPGNPVSSMVTTPSIAAANTWQVLFTAPTAPAVRKGCIIQNTSGGVLYFTVGAVSSGFPTSAAFYLSPGGSFSCAYSNGAVEQGTIEVSAPVMGQTFSASGG
jgi:hypothetical protein